MSNQTNSSGLFQQPRPLYIIFIVEFWERFGYYGLQALIAYYFVQQLGFTENRAFATFGAFAALVYALVSIGGYLGDKVFGTKRTLFMGAFFLMAGYFLMGLATYYHELVFISLGIIAVGNGLFKANPSNLVSKCYEENDKRLDGAFILFYMSVNLGSFFSMSITPMLADKLGYNIAFFICGFGLLIGIICFYGSQKILSKIGTPADFEKFSWAKFIIIMIGSIIASFICAYVIEHPHLAKILLMIIMAIVITIFFVVAFKENNAQRMKMYAAFILMIQAVLFFISYAQMPTSLNFFAIHNVNPYLLGLELNPIAFQALNPLVIIIGSPILAALFFKLSSKGKDFSMPTKFTFGMLLCALGFLTASLSAYMFADEKGIVSAWFLALVYLFQSIGEVLISGLGAAMICSLVPKRMTGFMLGAWFLTQATSFLLGSSVAKLSAIPKEISDPLQSLPIYGGFFLKIGIACVIITIIMALLVPVLKRMMQHGEPQSHE